jgi:hypothetical protein
MVYFTQILSRVKRYGRIFINLQGIDLSDLIIRPISGLMHLLFRRSLNRCLEFIDYLINDGHNLFIFVKISGCLLRGLLFEMVKLLIQLFLEGQPIGLSLSGTFKHIIIQIRRQITRK